uniref:Uncharacterized protein n=1 Tax=Babesia bovis TaxID=5865 RepID=S6B3I5_BABBO|nr:hypothetical protein [Babesia bovis]
MIYDRSETIWRLKTKFKGFESKGPFSTTYKLPLEVNNERIKTTLEVKIPLSYPNKQVLLKLVNPISHPWTDDKGNVQVPPWAESLNAVELVSAFIEQLQELHNKNVAPIQLDSTSQVMSTMNSGNSSKCQCSTLGSVRPHDLQSPNGNIVSSTWDFDGTSPCTNHDTEKYDIQVNEMVLNACWNPPKGAMEAIKRANRDEMDYLISNEDIRWKILKNTPEMTPLIKELHKIQKKMKLQH